ncbi:MAG: hypothetical protein AB7K67_04055 [Hyphomicrobiaceae bacterium]|jgi:hypothetical protein
MTLRELEELLAIYGADRRRWPERAGARAEALVATNAAARRLQDAAAALDKVMAAAPRVAAARMPALAERIVAAAQRTPRVINGGRGTAPETPTVVPLPVRKPVSKGSLFGLQMRQAVSVLAAALVVGVFIGASGFSQNAVMAVEDVTGVDLGASPSTLVQLSSELEEDQLL